MKKKSGPLQNGTVGILLAASALLASGPLSAAPHLYVATEEAAPSSMLVNGQIAGRNADKFREVLQRSGIAHEIDILPWKRAYILVQSRPDMCVFGMSRTTEREKLFKWVGPTDEAEWTFYGLADHNFRLDSLEDARGLRIGTYNGDARDEFLRARGFRVDPAQNDMANVQKLLMKRIDVWPVAMRTGAPPLAEPGWGGRIVPIYTFNRVGIYMACNVAVPDALVAQMNAALDTMRRDGSNDRIDQKYAHWTPPVK
jgi:polar amino acid transport system substrate-binding protein